MDPGRPGTSAPTGGEAEETGVSAEMLERLRPHMAESLMVLDRDWTVRANLAPPGGLIGRGLGLGVHTLEDMHPDDAIRIMDLGVQAFSTEPGWQGSQVVRMRRGDGAYGRYEITAINRFDDPIIDGMVVRTRELPEDLIDDVPDIERTSAIETLAELLPSGVLLLDRHGRVVFANGAACAMAGREPEALKREGLLEQVAETDREQVASMVARVTARPGRESCTVTLATGSVERAELRLVSDGGAEVTSVVVTIEDVTERDRAQAALHAEAHEDPLTGLGNRRALLDALTVRLSHASATTVAFVDLDGFKAVNDTWGHARGDELLIAVAGALRADLGPAADLARLGGDEFVAVIDGPLGTDAELADRLRGAVAAQTRQEDMPVTCSVGIARAVPGDSPETILCRADEAMYAAKDLRR